MKLLEERVSAPLSGILGAQLQQVLYRPLIHECAPSHINDLDLYIGGEVLLVFHNGVRRFISWNENAGWDSHFSVGVQASSWFRPGALEEHDASETDLWRNATGKTLTGVACFGWEQSPHVLKFTFEGETRYIGSSYQTQFGDGDDVYFCDDVVKPELDSAQTIWKSKANNGVENIAP